jgi:uncharacterized protein YndB with AHSA1/START domain
MSHTLTMTTPSDCEIAMIRTFDAPRTLVFEAWTTPALVRQWLGFGGWSLAICEIDLRVGGVGRFVWRRASTGAEMRLTQIYREVAAPERLVCTEKFDEPWYEGDALITVVFDERNGQTTVTQTVRYGSKAIRDGVLASPMETGVAASYDALAGVVASMVAQEASER